MKLRQSHRAAFTLAEVMVAASVTLTAMGALAAGAIAVHRGIAAAEYQVECQEDQLRAMDYLTRDLRRAITVKVEDQKRKLTVTIPGYKFDPKVPMSTPDISAGTVKYDEPPLTIVYVINAGRFMRYENGAGVVLSSRIEEFFADDADLPRVTLRVNFVPRFSRTPNTAFKAATTVSTTVYARNWGGLLR